MQHFVGSAPAVEAGVDGLEHFGKRCEVPVVRREAPGQLPNSFDRGELRAVWRQKHQPQMSSVAAQKWRQEDRVMIASVVQYQHHAPSRCLLAQQTLQKALERGGVENRAHHANELATVQADGAKAGDGLAGWRMPQDRVLDFRWYPHAAARTVLLEVTFIQAPQFDVGAASQATEFFLLPRLSADPIERLGGAACVTESPVDGIVVGIAVLQGPPRSGDANVPTRPDRPTGLPTNQSLAGSYVNPPAGAANPSHPTSAVVPLARLPAERPGRPARSDSPSVARSCRSRRTTPRLLGRIAPPSPTAIHAVGDRSATPRYVRSPAESLFASPQHPRSAACASPFSQRKERCNHITMLHYLCRRV